jgi:hypothetical protein
MPDLFDSNIPIVLFLFRTESPTIDEARSIELIHDSCA